MVAMYAAAMIASRAAIVMCLATPLLAAEPLFQASNLTVASFSPDGKVLMTVSAEDRQVHFWDATSGEEVNRFGVGVSRAVFSGDGSRVVTFGEDKLLRTFDTRTGKALRRIEGAGDALTGLAMSHDASLIAVLATGETSVKFYKAADGAAAGKTEVINGVANAISFSSDGRLIRVELKQGAAVFEVASGKPSNETFGEPAKFGLRTAIGAGWITDVKTNEDLRPLERPIDGLPMSHAFSADGSRLIVGTGKAALFKRNPDEPGMVYVFDGATGKQIASFTGHRRQVTQVGMAANGKAAFSRDAENRLMMWKLP
jgi:WD40 repeat protein